MSTMPTTFQGGLQPVAAHRARSAGPASRIDPDDFRGGFAVWSGTSFAAPLVGRADRRGMLGTLEPSGTVDDAGRRAVAARMGAVAAFTGRLDAR